jgi:predicted metalloendopeptidase
MTEATKHQALAKLHAIANKIGYPEKWLDYGSVQINRSDLAANVRNARAFQVNYNLQKIGRKLDRNEWEITTPTVNAYYYPPENSINFPAGVLQPPLFDPAMDDAVNFGAIGWLIGHELTHGFDDQGSKFDGEGNLTNWWTQNDREEFDKRTSCIADQYQQFVVVDDIHLNGRLTLGENTADNGGIRLAFAAMHQAASHKGGTQNLIDGFTPDQRFFIGFAQQWCANVTPERLRVIAKVDPHAPVRFRTLGTLRNLPEFARAFGCKSGQKMVSANACRVW